MKLVLSFLLLFTAAACRQGNWTTEYTGTMKKLQADKQFKPRGSDQGILKYYEGTIVSTGLSTVNDEVSLLQSPNAQFPDGISSASILFKQLDPTKASNTISKDAVEVLFFGAMTNNPYPNMPLPEVTLKAFIRDDNTIEYAEWEYIKIGCQNLKYYGTYRVVVTNNSWNPNATAVSMPGNTNAVGTASWDNENRQITFTTTVTGTNGNVDIVNSVFKFKELYREYEAIIHEDYSQHENYHIKFN